MLETFRPATETLSPWGTRNTQQWLLAHHCLWLELCNQTLVPRCFLGYRRCCILGMTLKIFLITKACVKTIEDMGSLSLSVWSRFSVCLESNSRRKPLLPFTVMVHCSCFLFRMLISEKSQHLFEVLLSNPCSTVTQTGKVKIEGSVAKQFAKKCFCR